MKCDIIIPVWNQLELTRSCIGHILKNTGCPYRLILIDNASGPDTKNYLEGLKSAASPELCLMRNEENLGFVKAVNQGLKASSAEYVCIMNNDTVPAPGWLERMIDFAESHEDVGLVNPQCDGHLNAPVEEYAKGLLKNKGVYMEMNQCQGFCMVIKRKVLDKIGYLDESFGIGGFDDTDLSMRAYRAGYRSVAVYDSYVYHRQHASFNALHTGREAVVKKAEEEYFKKWPRHLRMAVGFSAGEGRDEEIKNLLKGALFLAREWCWINLWVFGDEKKNREMLARLAEEAGMPRHQNIKMNFLPGRFKNLQILARVAERSFGPRKRKKYDMVFVDDERTGRFLMRSRLFHKTAVSVFDARRDMKSALEKAISAIRRQDASGKAGA